MSKAPVISGKNTVLAIYILFVASAFLAWIATFIVGQSTMVLLVLFLSNLLCVGLVRGYDWTRWLILAWSLYAGFINTMIGFSSITTQEQFVYYLLTLSSGVLYLLVAILLLSNVKRINKFSEQIEAIRNSQKETSK